MIKFMRRLSPLRASGINKTKILFPCIVASLSLLDLYGNDSVLKTDPVKKYIDFFNQHDEELYKNEIPNDKSWDFLKENIPLLDCPDEEIQKTFYFRWWTLRKHLKKIEGSWAITEFVPKVSWSWDHNLINCANSHQINESRWLADRSISRDNIKVWLLKYTRRGYSSWIAYTLLNYIYLTGEEELAKELLPNVIKMYLDWEKGNRDAIKGLYFQNDAGDGMEGAIGGGGFRPTVNAYAAANAYAISELALMVGDRDLAEKYRLKGDECKKLLFKELWNPEHEFFEVKNAPWSTAFFGLRLNGDKQLTKQAEFKCSNEKMKGFNNDSDPKNSWEIKTTPYYRVTKGTQGWMEYKLQQPAIISSLQLYFARNHIPMHLIERDFPEAFRVLYKSKGEWVAVQNLEGKLDKFDKWNELKFTPVETQEVRFECDTYGYNREKLDFIGVREQLGYVPWYFNLPEAQHSVAWKEAIDTKGFKATWGLTTAEQRHPKFEITYTRHACLWNGPIWPFATSQTLTGLANLLNNYEQKYISKADYYDMLKTYAFAHQIKKEDGTIVSWIDENQNPFTGEWIAKKVLENFAERRKDLTHIKERGKDYNHSTYCDLVIQGLVGFRPQANGKCIVNPLVPENKWKYFCLDRIPYMKKQITILWDEDGTRYNKGKGFRIFSDGVEIHQSAEIKRVEFSLK